MNAFSLNTPPASCLRYLSEDGAVLKPIPEYLQDVERLKQAYENIVISRRYDQKAIALQRTGQLGTYPSVLGQEAIGTAIGLAMQSDDVFVPYYRDFPAMYLRGVKMHEMLLYWGGDERGNAYAECPKDLPVCVPIATQLCHAAGIASAMRICNEKNAVLVSCGEGATSKGDFYEALNLAGAWHLPLVVVVNNNQWAISTPRSQQTASETIAQKAVGAGMPGVQVDGNDYFAMFDAVSTALKRAKTGKGATLIEAVSYRLSDHTTADDASRYRAEAELKAAWLREPLRRLKAYMAENELWDAEQEQAMQARVTSLLEQEVATYLARTPESPEAMFEHLFATLPEALHDQYFELKLGAYEHQVPQASRSAKSAATAAKQVARTAS